MIKAKRKNAMSETVNIRELALDILLNVTKQGEYSHIAEKQVLEKYQYLNKKDRAFLTRLTEGTLENLIQIDYIINQFSKVPVHKMKPVICCIIRSGVYQIRFMDAVPDAAACNEAVRLAKKKGFQNLSGFVNGVLRNISRSKDKIVWPDKEEDRDHWLSVHYSIPVWMIQMWRQEQNIQPEKMEQMLQAFLSPAPVTIRTNTNLCTPKELVRRLEAEGVRVVACDGLSDAFQISCYDHLKALSSFQEGLFYVQDVSSMLVANTAAAKEDDFVLDVCSAPGGKAVHMAQMMHGTGHVLARDLTQYKINLLLENRNRCKIANMQAQVWDARVLDPAMVHRADIVVADLPCSGLGVMRRKKDIRYRMTPEKIVELARLQREILSVVFQYVKPGGKMIYSTCTVSRQENEENTRWFLKEHEDFKLLSSRQILPGEERDGFYIAEFLKGQ